MEPTSFSATKTIHGIDVYYEYYEHSTANETVVLLHGFLSSLFSFRHLVPLLKMNHSVVLIDLPPFGKSGHSWKYQYSYKNLARTVVGLLYTLNPTPFTVIGHSMGGQIALNILYYFPEQAKQAVLLCSSGYLQPAKKPLILASYLPLFPLIVKAYLARSGLERNLKNVVFNQTIIDDEMRAGYLNPFTENQIFKGLTGLLRHREGDLLPEALNKIHAPSLLIWGENDKVVPLHIGKRLAKDLPNSKLVVLNETGHLVPEERPEEVYNLINQFIKINGSR